MTNISPCWETTSSVSGEEHLEGMLDIRAIPPLDIENPEVNHKELDIDLVLIDLDKLSELDKLSDVDFDLDSSVRRILVYWDNATWVLCVVEHLDSKSKFKEFEINIMQEDYHDAMMARNVIGE